MRIIEANGVYRTVDEGMVEPFVKDVVLEFYANWFDAKTDNTIIPVFVRGKTFEFSPRMINRVFQTPDTPYCQDSELHVDASMHSIAKYLTGGRVQSWRGFRPRLLTHTMGSLFGVCCLNWMPTTNNTYVTKERAKLLYMLAKKTPFHFLKLVFDQIPQSG